MLFVFTKKQNREKFLIAKRLCETLKKPKEHLRAGIGKIDHFPDTPSTQFYGVPYLNI